MDDSINNGPVIHLKGTVKCDQELIRKMNGALSRWAQGIGKKDFMKASQDIGVTSGTASRWLDEEDYPVTASHVLHLSGYFRVPVDEIYGFVPQQRENQRWVLVRLIQALPEEPAEYIEETVSREWRDVRSADEVKAIKRPNRREPVPGFARRINLHRTEQKVTARELAEFAGSNEMAYTTWQLETHPTSMQRVIQAAMRLGLSLDYLLGTDFPYSCIGDEKQRRLFSQLQELNMEQLQFIAQMTAREARKKAVPFALDLKRAGIRI